jgi:hypothetical protein
MKRVALVLVLLVGAGLAAPSVTPVGGPQATPGDPQTDDSYLQYCGNYYTYWYGDSLGQGLGVKLTPAQYPVRVDTLCFYFANAANSIRWRVRVWDDDGTGGSPGTVLLDSVVRTQLNRWNAIDIASRNLRITSGSFYVFMYWDTLDLSGPNGWPQPYLGLDNGATANVNFEGYLSGTGGHTSWPFAYNFDLMIRAYVVDMLSDVGVTRILTPSGTIDSTASVTPACSVYNYGRNAASSYNVLMRVGSGYSQTALVTSHAPGTAQYVQFASSSAWPRGSQAVTCSTYLAGDQAPGNDARVGAVNVVVHDAAVTAITAPTGAVDSGATVAPSAMVANQGTQSETFDVICGIGAWADTQNVTVGAGSSQAVNFAQWTAQTRGSNSVAVRTALTADMVPVNDEQSGAVTVNVHDVGVAAITSPGGSVPPGTLAPAATLHNYGTVREACTVTFTILPGTYSQTVGLPAGLPPGIDTTVSFADWTGTPGSFEGRCSLYLVTEQVAANNVAALDFQVGNVDVAALAIVAPAGRVDTGDLVTPTATVANYGEFPVTFTAWLTISDLGGVVYEEEAVVTNLGVGEDTDVTFADWLPTHLEGDYTARCSTWIASDGVTSNNVVRAAFTVRSGVPVPPGWTETHTPVPLAPSSKAVKDGGWVAYDAGRGLFYVYKGYKSSDFYSYAAADSSWQALTGMPTGIENKPAYKGAVGVSDGNGRIYATKGNNTPGFWRYSCDGDSWSQLPDVPLGLSNKRVKGGTDLAYVTLGETSYVYLLKGYKTEFYRYNTVSGEWQSLADAPTGVKNKWDKGSWIVHDGEDNIYAHKAKYHEFYAYSISANNWGPVMPGMPLASGQTGKSKKSKDGADAVCLDGTIWALKGGNTQDFFAYDVAGQTWVEKETIPAFGSTGKKKRIKAGGSMATDGMGLYALKGNKTLEFWRYGFPEAAAGGRTAMPVVQSGRSVSVSRLHVGPNPVTDLLQVSYALPHAGPATLVVADVTGRVVASRAFAASRGGSFRLDVRGLSRGVYLVQLAAEESSTTAKVVVSH